MTYVFPVRGRAYLRAPRHRPDPSQAPHALALEALRPTEEGCRGCGEWGGRTPGGQIRCLHSGLGCWRSPARIDPWTKGVICPLRVAAAPSVQVLRSPPAAV